MMDKNQLPTHVSLIMDGNGRWAKQRGKERLFGHLEGVESVRVIAHECVELGIKYISAFGYTECSDIINNHGIEVKYLLPGMVLMIIGIVCAYGKYTKKDLR